jgi:hypothetical protein
MKRHYLKFCLLFTCVILITSEGSGQASLSIRVETDNPLAEIQATMWGLFFKDINFVTNSGTHVLISGTGTYLPCGIRVENTE